MHRSFLASGAGRRSWGYGFGYFLFRLEDGRKARLVLRLRLALAERT